MIFKILLKFINFKFSNLMAFISRPLLTRALNFFKFSSSSYLCLKKPLWFSWKIINEEKKIITLTKWAWLDRTTHIYMYKFQQFLALELDSFGKLFLNCLPRRHPLHTWSRWLLQDNPLTISFLERNSNPPKLRCSNWRCQSRDASM